MGTQVLAGRRACELAAFSQFLPNDWGAETIFSNLTQVLFSLFLRGLQRLWERGLG